MKRPRPVVAIDGPAGAGKSTIAKMVADQLGFVLVDTGALYRAVALRAREEGVSWADGPGLGALANKLSLEFRRIGTDAPRLHIDGIDRSADIRSPEISMGASDVSKLPEVRDALLGLQRNLGAQGGVVLEGRDIGTVVFPDAEAKIFLTASPETRARRRQDELLGRGVQADFEQTLADVKARDKQDSMRPIAPLKPATDSVTLDSTGLAIDEVVERVIAIVKSRSS